MAATKQRASKASTQRDITLRFDGGDVASTVAAQMAWAYQVAAGIERGELPDAKHEHERRMIAAIIRHAADELHVPKVTRRGNPKFVRKLPDDDTVPLMVGMQIAQGAEPKDAVHTVALDFAADDNTVLKLFRRRRPLRRRCLIRWRNLRAPRRRNSREIAPRHTSLICHHGLVDCEVHMMDTISVVAGNAAERPGNGPVASTVSKTPNCRRSPRSRRVQLRRGASAVRARRTSSSAMQSSYPRAAVAEYLQTLVRERRHGQPARALL